MGHGFGDALGGDDADGCAVVDEGFFECDFDAGDDDVEEGVDDAFFDHVGGAEVASDEDLEEGGGGGDVGWERHFLFLLDVVVVGVGECFA